MQEVAVFNREFYENVSRFAGARGISMAQGIREYMRENNLRAPESVPADTEQVKQMIEKLLHDDKEIIEALKQRP